MEKKILSILFLAFLFFLNPIEGFGQGCSDANPPTVSISSNASNNTICAGETVTFTATPQNVGSSPTYQWRVNGVNQSGNGATFTTSNLGNNHSVSVVMNPNCNGATNVTSNSISTTVNPLPTVSAGGAISVFCQGGTTGALGGTFGGGATSAVWSDGGAGGSFTNNSGSNPGGATYTASASAPASITLTLTSAGGSCGTVSDSKTLTVNQNPTVSSGGAIPPICQGGTTGALGGSFGGGATSAVWSDGGAGGSFTNNSGSNPGSTTYTASSTAPTSITLTLSTVGGSCGSVQESKTLTVNPNPTVNAGGAIAAICQGGTTAALGGSFGGGATSAIWSDGGAGGNFTNNSGSNPSNTTYTASSSAAATITLTLTTSGGLCGTATATKTLSVNANPTVNAGGAIAPICQGGTTGALGGSFGGGATSAVWSDGGAGGSFTNNSGSNPGSTTYTASAAAPATITLTLTTGGGSCGTVNATKTLTVNPNPTVNAGTALSAICQGGTTAALGGSFGGGATSAIWSDGGAGGSFSNNTGTTPNTATYTAPANAPSSITLTLTTAGGSCGTVNATKALTVTPTVTPSVSITSTSTAICTTAPSGSTPVTFTATPANGGTNPTYQWRNNGVNIPGATNATYIANSLAIGSKISVEMTSNAVCPAPVKVTSSEIAMTSYTGTPSNWTGNTGSITLPASVCPPATIPISIPAVANAEYYVWTLPPGFTISTGQGTNNITVSVGLNAAVGRNQNITVQAFNPCGSNGSKSASLNVDSFTGVTVPSPSATICAGNSITVVGTLTGNAASGTWSAPSGTFTNIVNTSTTVTATYTPAITSGDIDLTITTNTPTGCSNTPGTAKIKLTVNQPPSITTQPVAIQTLCSGSTAVFSVTATGTGLTYQWQKNETNISGATSSTYQISSPTTADSGNYKVIVSGTSPCTSVTSTISELVINEKIAISSQPIASQTLCSGSSTTLSVTATGTGLTYQWQKNGANISGANASSLALNNLTTADSGEYTVLITGTSPCEPLLSEKALVTVNEVVTITDQPTPSQNLCSGSTATFTVGATGTGLTYQWKKNGNNISGQTTNTLTLTNVTTAESGDYTVEVKGLDPCQSQTSSIAKLEVNEIVNITSQPVASQTLCSGSTASFSVAATGTGLTYQWKKDGNNIAGATNSILTLSNISTGDSADYTVEISGTDPCSPLTSDKSNLVVNEIIAITEQPLASQTLCVGSTANFSVNATGTGLTYQWKKNGTDITNATSATLSLQNITTADAGEYTVLVTGTNPCEPALSAQSTLIVNELTVITKDLEYSDPVSVCVGFPFSFEIEAAGTGLTFEWYRGSTLLSNTTSTLSVSQASSSDAGIYTVQVKGACGEVTSNEVTLVVNQNLTITTQPEPTIPVCLGENSISLSIVVTGDVYDYVWRKNGIPISDGDGTKYSGTATANLTIKNLALADSDTYDVVISSPEGSCSQIISTPSVVTVYDPPTVDAGPDLEVCSTQTSIALSGATANNHTSLIWTTTGGGQINNATDISTATYSPIAADFGNELTFTLTSKIMVGDKQICADAVDTRKIIITPQPIITQFSYTSDNTAVTGNFCETDNTNYTPHTAGDNLSGGSGVFSVDNTALSINSSTGEFNPNGTSPGAYVITYTYTAGSQNSACTLATKVFTVNITAKPIADFSYENTPFCSDAANPSPLMGTDAVKGTFSSTTGLVFSDPATGEINIGASTPGTYTVTNSIAATNGCSIVTATSEITINEKPIADFSYPASEFCSDTANPVAQFSGKAVAGVFSEKNGATGLVFVSSSTGEINISGSQPGNYIIVNTVEIEGDGCDPVIAELPITITQKSNPVFSYNTTGEYCISDGIASITEGHETGGTFVSQTIGAYLNSETGEIKWNSTDNIIGEHIITYTITGTGGCSDVSHQVTIKIDSLPVGGELNFQGIGRVLETCSNPGSDYSIPLELTGYAGTIARWRYKEGSDIEWKTINHTGSILSPEIIRGLGINKSTIFEVELINGGCTSGVYSQNATLSIISSEIAPNPVNASPEVLCAGGQVTLTASTGYGSGPGFEEGGAFDFSSITNMGWRIKNKDGVESNFDSSADNGVASIWLRTNPLPLTTAHLNAPYNTYTYSEWDSSAGNEGNKGFAIVSGPNPSTLETSIFNLFAVENPVLTFDQAYNLTPGSAIYVDISTDGGANYESVPLFELMATNAADGTSNNYNSFGDEGPGDRSKNKITLDLTKYAGLDNLRIRFRYEGTRPGDVWAVDAISLPVEATNVDMIWTDYTDPANPIVIGSGTSEIWTPSIIGLNEFEIRTKLTFDSTGAVCPVVENFSTVSVFVFDKYTSTAEAMGGSCGFENVQLKGSIVNSAMNKMESFPTLDGYSAKWEVVSQPAGYTFSEAHFSPSVTDTAAVFSPGIEGEYTLQYSLSRPEDEYKNESCLPVYQKATFSVTACTTLDFDGVDDFVDLGEDYTGDYSIEAWIRPEAATGTIISTPQLEINMGDLPGVTPNNRWYHIAVDSDGKLYVDGIPSGTTISKTGDISRSFIGATWNASKTENHFSGWIEEVRLWNGKISEKNIRFTMNQRLKAGGNIGVVVDMTHPDAPSYTSLAGYYQLLTTTILNGGYTPDLAGTAVNGKLRNMTTTQENTAPLPYYTAQDGAWDTPGTWAQPEKWMLANTGGITWNIVKTSHNVSATRDISVLGLVSEANTLDMVGTIPTDGSHLGVGTGNALTISHYLKLDGIIDLNGESQLLQPELSIIYPLSAGHLDRDQQGKRNSFIYNYWASPVSTTGSANNGGYTVGGVLLDGTNPATPDDIIFKPEHWAADFARTVPITISTYWLWTYKPAPANIYAEWDHIGETGAVKTGEGFTMKGTDGTAALEDGQNYTFRGKPHNGDINLNIGANQNYLIGNPFASAFDSHEFIRDNLKNVAEGKNDENVFDGSLYFWDHFVVVDHILKEYIGGYAVLNLNGAVPAVSIDERINDNDAESGKIPQRYIPVAQGFLINSTNPDPTSTQTFGGTVKFKNSQREFKIEGAESIFLKPETVEKTGKTNNSEHKKIRLSFTSPIGYRRQILVGAVPGTTDGFDLGYDANLFDDNVEDMYWVQGPNHLVIQGVNDFNKERVLPLGVKIKENKDFTIRIDTVENADKNLKIYLKDKLNDSIHDLRKGHYVSKSEPGTINDRFEIIFYKEEPVPPVTEVPVEVDEDDEIYKEFGIIVRHGRTDRELQILNPHELNITNMYIFDLNGNKLEGHNALPIGKEFRMPVRNYSSGIYIVQLVVEGRVVSKKIIINN